MAISKKLDQAVRARARERCEYCLTPQAAVRLRFWIDHIIASQHAGKTASENLALACPFCNRHKGPNLTGIDPATGSFVPLFNPRRDQWSDHFQISGAEVVGRTEIGRATVNVLAMNHPLQLFVRAALVREGVPPFASERQ